MEGSAVRRRALHSQHPRTTFTYIVEAQNTVNGRNQRSWLLWISWIQKLQKFQSNWWQMIWSKPIKTLQNKISTVTLMWLSSKFCNTQVSLKVKVSLKYQSSILCLSGDFVNEHWKYWSAYFFNDMFHSCVQVHHSYMKFLQVYVHLHLVFERKVSRGRIAPHMEGLRQNNVNVAKYLSKVPLTCISRWYPQKDIFQTHLYLFLTFNSYPVTF